MQELVAVSSSNITAIGYEPVSETLRVKFTTGKIYDYAHVPADKHAKIMAATSVGSTFNQLVKSQPSNHPYTQVA